MQICIQDLIIFNNEILLWLNKKISQIFHFMIKLIKGLCDILNEVFRFKDKN